MMDKGSSFMVLTLDRNMISSNLIETVRACAKDHGVKSVWLFGSALEDEDQATDIDLAIEGLVPEKFFDFYGRLFFELPKPVDLIDLEQEPPISAIVRSRGVRIYER
jgi:predicted nucleotidyltransferase